MPPLRTGISTASNDHQSKKPLAVLRMAEAPAISMDIERKPAASGKGNELQLPWVEKYRPNR